jgi:hypothetical protein
LIDDDHTVEVWKYQDKVTNDKSVGGVNFTMDKLPLNIKSENGAGPLFSLPVEQLKNIEGFTPTILYMNPTGNLLNFVEGEPHLSSVPNG